MSVKRSDIKYTGSAFIKYQLWFHALSQAFLVGIYSPVILDLTKTINFTEGWLPPGIPPEGEKIANSFFQKNFSLIFTYNI